MSITDVISHLRLDFFPQVALVIFFFIFVVVVIRIYSPRMREDMDTCTRLPFDEGASTAAHHDKHTPMGERR